MPAPETDHSVFTDQDFLDALARDHARIEWLLPLAAMTDGYMASIVLDDVLHQLPDSLLIEWFGDALLGGLPGFTSTGAARRRVDYILEQFGTHGVGGYFVCVTRAVIASGVVTWTARPRGHVIYAVDLEADIFCKVIDWLAATRPAEVR